jgi:hypothetical protein
MTLHSEGAPAQIGLAYREMHGADVERGYEALVVLATLDAVWAYCSASMALR